MLVDDDNGKHRSRFMRRKRIRAWAIRVLGGVFVWAAFVQLAPMTATWHPRLLKSWPAPCFERSVAAGNSTNSAVSEVDAFEGSVSSPLAIRPRRVYRSKGYLMLSCNGGLNQMRAAICDMVAVARYLNTTLVIPELDKNSFWADTSNFEDIFNVDHFINSLRDELKIIKKLPQKVMDKLRHKNKQIYSVPPISWSNMTYYSTQILPLMRKHKVIHFVKTDARLANNGVPPDLQKLRCHVNYDALKFTPRIVALAEKLISILNKNSYFVGLHLRYEMDMLSFSGCSHGCTDEEAEELTKKRYLTGWWKEKDIDPEQRRLEGRCPLTPEETALVLKAFSFERNTTVYIAAGTTFGGARRLAAIRDLYPNTVEKEMLLSRDDLKPIRNHSNQMAALDYLVALASNVFLPTYDGNMAKVVEGHRRYNHFRQSIILDRKIIVEYLDLYKNEKISWDQFSSAIKNAHKDCWGQRTRRKVIPDQPKVEDYFYANPQECLPDSDLHYDERHQDI